MHKMIKTTKKLHEVQVLFLTYTFGKKSGETEPLEYVGMSGGCVWGWGGWINRDVKDIVGGNKLTSKDDVLHQGSYSENQKAMGLKGQNVLV